MEKLESSSLNHAQEEYEMHCDSNDNEISKDDLVNDDFIQSVSQYFIAHPDEEIIDITAESENTFTFSLNGKKYVFKDDKILNIVKEPISDGEFVLKILVGDQMTQAYRIKDTVCTPLEIVNVDVKGLYEAQKDGKLEYDSLTEEQKKLIDYLKQDKFNPKPKKNNLKKPIETVPIDTSLGFSYENNKIHVTQGYDFIPVTNSKGEIRYKTKKVKPLGGGASVDVYKDTYSFNLKDLEKVIIKRNSKVWKQTSFDDEDAINSLETELRFSLFFKEEFKPRYYLVLPDGTRMIDQVNFGKTLTKYLKEKEPSSDERIDLGLSFLKALVATHEKITHRDIKPSNIFVKDDEQGRPIVTIGDFGYSIRRGKKDGRCVGTPRYLAPELLSHNSIELTQKQDIFSASRILAKIFGAQSIGKYLNVLNDSTYSLIFNMPSILGVYKNKIERYHKDPDIINDIKQNCGEFDVYSLIEKMCNEKPEERLTAKKLLSEYYGLINKYYKSVGRECPFELESKNKFKNRCNIM